MPLALGFEFQATIGMFFAGNADVTEGDFHGVIEIMPRGVMWEA